MVQDSIKQLFQYEKVAKEVIASARKEREEMKRKAKTEAQEIVVTLKEQRDKQICEKISENIEKLKEIDEEIRAENDERIEALQGKDLNKIANELLEVIMKDE